MTPTTYQKPEIRDANDNIIQQGAFGKNTALANATNDGWIDYVANDLEFLYDLAKDEVVPVPALPASGQMNKTYLLTTTGVSYRWSGTEWVAVSSSEAVGRAESAANLAEQWATKTSGTVDGTEYSAKYYAEQAQQSADDAQDTADDMATHLVQIDKNTGGVAKNSKRISNIEKLLQGNLYDYDTDDDVAYTKTVPSGALPYAGIEKIGGKTLVWNQLGDFGTITVESGKTTYGFNAGVSVVTGHKYYFCDEVNTEGNGTHGIYARVNGSNVAVVTANKATPKQIFTSPCSATSIGGPGTVEGNLWMYASQTGGNVTEGDTITNVMLIDLTLMFGAGNEPSTVAEFEAMFPADYYPYNAGTLLSAGVTEVKSVGKNLCDLDTAWANVSTATKNADGEWTIATSLATIVSVKVWENTDGYSGQITVSYQRKDSGASGCGYRLQIYYKDGTYELVGTSDHQNAFVSFTVTSNASKVVDCVKGTYNSNIETYIKNVQIEKGTTATAYAPYMEATMPIPAEVQALTGYGWSAGSVSNYIDFERKVFVQNVGRVVVTSADVPAADSDYIGTSTISGTDYVWIRYFKYSLGGSFADRRVGGYSGVAKTGTVVINNTSFMASQYRTFFTVANRDALLTAIGDGMDLYYELATPVETDISAYLTDDNLIEVGAGGTLTFENSNGDDYHIPVPSDVTYMIDLQSAIGE